MAFVLIVDSPETIRAVMNFGVAMTTNFAATVRSGPLNIGDVDFVFCGSTATIVAPATICSAYFGSSVPTSFRE